MAGKEHNLQTGLWVEGHMRRLNACARPCYVVQKGNYASGLVLLKLNSLRGGIVRLLVQERDFMADKLVWVNALGAETVEEGAADAYVARAMARDPDLWVIEVEDQDMVNPFVDMA